MIKKLRALMMRTLPLMITCEELDGFIDDYLEDMLPARQRRIFDLHLRMCQDCRSYLDNYKKTITLSQAAFRQPQGPIPEDMPDELVKAIVAARDRDA